MKNHTHDDSYNVRLCLDGNINAFEPLVRRYQNAAFAVAMSFMRDRTDAEDVVQDSFVSAFCKLSQLKDPAIFGSWLHRIVVNRCKDWSHRNKTSRLVRIKTQSEQVQNEYPLAVQNHRKYIERFELWDEVEKLPKHYRSVVTLYYYTGFSLKEPLINPDVRPRGMICVSSEDDHVEDGVVLGTCEGVFAPEWVPDRPVCPRPPVLDGLLPK